MICTDCGVELTSIDEAAAHDCPPRPDRTIAELRSHLSAATARAAAAESRADKMDQIAADTESRMRQVADKMYAATARAEELQAKLDEAERISAELVRRSARADHDGQLYRDRANAAEEQLAAATLQLKEHGDRLLKSVEDWTRMHQERQALEVRLAAAESALAAAREALRKIANNGKMGVSEGGCLWCWEETVNAPQGTGYSPYRENSPKHLPDCPVGAALSATPPPCAVCGRPGHDHDPAHNSPCAYVAPPREEPK